MLERKGGHLYGETVDEKMADLLHKVGLIMSVNILNITEGVTNIERQ